MIPIISIELQGMKETLRIALAEQMLKQSAELDEAVTRAVEHYDVGREIETQVLSMIPRLISEAIKRAANDVLYNDDVQNQFRGAIVREILKLQLDK